MSGNSTVPATVGNNFVLLYYTLLSEKPHTLRKFYKENSSFTFGYEGKPQDQEETAFGSDDIAKIQQHFNFVEKEIKCVVSLAVVDCQPSLEGSVLVTVIGRMNLSTISGSQEPIPNPSRKFVQTFLLAVQTDPQGYYVLNDVFRYIQEEETSIPAQQQELFPPSFSSPQANAVPVPQEPPKVEEPVAVESHAVAPETHPVEPEVRPKETPAKHDGEKQVDKQATGRQKNAKSGRARQAKSEEPRNETKRNAAPTWANIAANKVAPEEPAPASQPVSPPEPKPEAEVQVQAQAQAQAPAQPQAKPQSKAIPLFISNLPYNTNYEEVKGLFSKYGEIKHMELKVVKGFCFIEFANENTGAQVLESVKAKPIVMKSRTLLVEERKHPKPQPGAFGDRKKENRRDRGGDRERTKGKSDQPKNYYKTDAVASQPNDNNVNGTNNAGTDSDGFHNVSNKGNRRRDQKKALANHQ